VLLTLAVHLLLASQKLSLSPTETVWVYANASTPGDGSYLRAWGSDGKSCPKDGEDAGEFSFSYLKWDLKNIPIDAKLISAKLEFYNVPDPGYSVDMAKKCPLEARPVVGQFQAKAWTFDMSAKVHPAGAVTEIFGSGYPTGISAGAPVSFSINLLAGPNLFGKALLSAMDSPTHTLSLCITSALDPSVEGRTCVYKLYGEKDPHENLRPKLTLVFEP
jgi:hypothetical protein